MGRRPQERNASRCCGNTSRTITCKTQKTSNTFSPTKRWARSLETKESVPLVWLSFWEPTYHQSKEPVKTEKSTTIFESSMPHNLFKQFQFANFDLEERKFLKMTNYNVKTILFIL